MATKNISESQRKEARDIIKEIEKKKENNNKQTNNKSNTQKSGMSR